jgi:hypothetical protein
MLTLPRDDVRSLSSHDLIDGEWLDAQSCAVFLGQIPSKGAALVRKKTFPAPGWAMGNGEPLWRIAEVSAWADRSVRPEPRDDVTSLYRHFDASGLLLYVGISLCPAQRTRAHRYGADWFRKVACIKVEWHPSREAAEEAELRAIRDERPAHNLAGVKIQTPMRKLHPIAEKEKAPEGA